MRACNLASGSDGNLTYIEVGGTKLLVDIGLCCSEVVKRLELLDINPREIDGIVLTHEHIDHVKGLDVFTNRFKTKIYARADVFEGLEYKINLNQKNIKLLGGMDEIGEAMVKTTPVPHDVPCYGISVYDNINKISIFTDFGHTNPDILENIKGSRLVYLESNYDEDMLRVGTKYPLSLKRRIAGERGHLSNSMSSELIAHLAASGTKQIVLSHLSKENNTPELAFKTAVETLKGKGIIEGEHLKIDVAKRVPGVIFRIK